MSAGTRWAESRARRLRHGVHVLGRLSGAALARARIPAPSAPDPGGTPDAERIVVLTTAFIGDLVLATPLLSTLRTAFPSARLTVLVPEGARDLLAESPVADHLVPLPTGSRDQLVERALSMRAETPDVVVVLPHTVEGALFAYATGAPVRVGHASQGRAFLLTRAAPNVRSVHEVERLLGLARALGVAARDAPPPCVWPSTRARAGAARHLAGLATHAGPLVVAALGAGSPARRWAPERWAALVEALIARKGARIVLLGGPEDAPVAREVLARIAGAEGGGARNVGATPILDLAGRTSLAEVAWLLDEADLMVGSDSGLLHLAAARGTRVVGLYGPGDPVAWGPWGPGHAVVRLPMACSPCFNHTCSSVACLRRLSVESVLGAAVTLLERAEP